MIHEEQFVELIRKLDTLIKLTALSIFRDKSKSESIIALSELGLENKEIAEVLGTTSDYVKAQKYIAKKTQEKRKDKNVEGDSGKADSEKSTENR